MKVCRPFHFTIFSIFSDRIVKLLQAKDNREKMIKIKYKQSPTGDRNVDVIIHSLIVVGSVNYLKDIAFFFVPDESFLRQWKKESKEDLHDGILENDENTNKMEVFLKIEEPDIFLVEKITDLNSEALMLNAEVQLQYWHVPKDGATSIRSTMDKIRCHTCRFNPKSREETMASILQPCTLSFTYDLVEETGLKINLNMSDLCLNVSPRSIQIIQNSVQAFFESLSEEENSESALTESEEDFKDLWLPK